MDRRNFIKSSKSGIKRIIFSRTFIVVLLLLVQAVFLFLIWGILKNYFFYSYWGTVLISAVTCVILSNRRGNPSYKLSWMFLILLLPVFGILFYIFVETQGVPKIINKMLDMRRLSITEYGSQDLEVFHSLERSSPETANLSRYLYKETHFPVYQNTRIRYFPSGEALFPELIKSLESAETFIFMEYFAFSEGKMWNTILDILKRKVKEGVEVRFLYDGTCSFKMPYNYSRQLES